MVRRYIFTEAHVVASHSFKYFLRHIVGMPRLVKIKGGYAVVHKITGKTIRRFTGKNAYTKAKKLVSLGY